jgi:hypothetical protein
VKAASAGLRTAPAVHLGLGAKSGYAVGGLLAGTLADLGGFDEAILVTAGLTATSGIVAAAWLRESDQAAPTTWSG